MKWIAAVILISATCALGQTTPKTKIYVSCTCDDPIGAQYATALRDAIARSPRYTLASASVEGAGKDKTYNWTLSIVSIDDTPATPGTSTAISVVLQIGIIITSQRIQVCGYSAVDRCAAAAMANLDSDLQR
jgi:hypothetical protein